MDMHNHSVLVVSAVFALVFAIMLLSLICYRQPDGEPSRFGGPTGRVQWLWALVPMAILGAVNLALIEPGRDHKVVQQAAEPEKNTKLGKLELAVAHK